jgi:hypothetical protein
MKMTGTVLRHRPESESEGAILGQQPSYLGRNAAVPAIPVCHELLILRVWRGGTGLPRRRRRYKDER